MLEMRQSLKLTQQLVMTPQLQQALKLLQAPYLELSTIISQELEENPLLEIADEDDYASASEEAAEDEPAVLGEVEQDKSASPELTGEGDGREEFDWNNYLEDYIAPSASKHNKDAEEEVSWDSFLVKPETLIEHLMWQLKMSQVSEEEFLAAEFIIKSLDGDGYLKVTLEEIAREMRCPLAVVESALVKVQDFEPVGVAARDLRECLLIQARALEGQLLVTEIIQNYLKDLEFKNYARIAKQLRTSEARVLLAIKTILAMNPKPGSIYTEDERMQTVIPDVFIVPDDGAYRVILNEEGLPHLRINNIYREIISNTDGEKDKAENRRYINERMQSARWLLKSLEQRQMTIRKVAESITKFQREFLHKGAGHLKPLILRDVADDVELHESTISRVVSNKYALTPHGTFPFKYFFSNSLSTADGDAVATTAVKEEIKNILLSEDAQNPYNDSQIAEKLKIKGINVARRTVAKYREMMNILPSSKRRRFL